MDLLESVENNIGKFLNNQVNHGCTIIIFAIVLLTSL